MTTPPKHYTTDTLVKFMDNPFAKDEEIEDEDTIRKLLLRKQENNIFL